LTVIEGYIPVTTAAGTYRPSSRGFGLEVFG
jgi:hypothetical protein